ncbi:hypothetical protein [Actinopolyspora halophila]|uniref:hypothetical protein n=1 Tax=Actinopolyspora halophila TaxID=1850 RepID=UPI000374D5F8|nr:hypothetical protein [Actinopolyspora halophila]
MDRALYVRYRHSSRLRGARFAELDVDLLDGHRLRFDRREERGSAETYAANVHLVLAEGVSSEELEWTDFAGWRWSGDTPPCGWQQAVENVRRLKTVLPAG